MNGYDANTSIKKNKCFHNSIYKQKQLQDG